MPSLFCNNCNQMVNASKKKESSAGIWIFFFLIMLGLVLLPFGFLPGVIVLGFAGLLYIVSLLGAFFSIFSKVVCPICQDSNFG